LSAANFGRSTGCKSGAEILSSGGRMTEDEEYNLIPH